MSDPTIWVMQGKREGDNSQARAVAGLLEGRIILKRLHFNGLYAVPNIILRSGLASLDMPRSDELRPPWPEIVIGTGRRTVPVARWIRQQSGERTKLIQIGRPRAPLSWFDLVITTAQYGLPDGPNVLRLVMPMSETNAPGEGELAHWRERLAYLPRPWTGLLVGGSCWPYRLDSTACRKIADSASQFIDMRGGALLMSTSPRTGVAAETALSGGFRVPTYSYRYAAGGPNPHRAILALADRFIVTSDSVSMMTEACRTGRDVYLIDLPRCRWRPRVPFDQTLGKIGIVAPVRAVDRFANLLVARRHAATIDDANARFTPASDETAKLRLHLESVLRERTSQYDRSVSRRLAWLGPAS